MLNATVDDIYATEDLEKPMSGGIFTQKAADAPFVYTYKVSFFNYQVSIECLCSLSPVPVEFKQYHELKYVISGVIVLEDRATGIKVSDLFRR